MKNRPNILIITSDQQRKDSMGCYNQSIQTKSLDLLAQDGVVCDRAYITHPTCTPSRASILTGQLASKHGAYTIGTALTEDAPMFSAMLKEGGYDTYFIGKPHFQQLSTEGSFEYHGISRDADFFLNFKDSYYGFDHISLYNGHTKYPFTAGMHYYIWLKEKGLTDADIEKRFNYVGQDKYREHGVWDIEREYHPSVFTSERAIQYLEERIEEKPFAMWISFSDPHDPHVVPEPYASMFRPQEVNYLAYVEGEHDERPACYNKLYHEGLEALDFDDGIGVPSAPTGKTFGDEQYFREITAIHHGMVQLMDEEIGKITDKLKEMGLYENTFIVYSTDHGDYLGNHGFVYKGFPAFEEVYNVPFIVKNIENKNSGTRCSSLLSHVDILPTILETAGVSIENKDYDGDGVSQLAVLEGIRDDARSTVFIENRPVEKGFYQKMIVNKEYKLVMYMDSEDGELYHLSTDPNQYSNLWSRVEYLDIKKDLLLQIYNKYADVDLSADNYSDQDILYKLWKQMHEEEPVSKRTSYS